MSGGSYEYLFAKEADQILGNQESLENMADRLAGLGYAKDAALETHRLLIRMRQLESYFYAVQTELGGIWRAIEWWDSSDAGEEEVREKFEAWRQGNGKEAAGEE